MSEIIRHNIFNVSFWILFAVVYALRIIHYTHMFQLNSYKPKVQLKWLLNNKKQFKSGRYQITSEMNNLTLVRNIMYGRQTPISISFNNVRTKDVLAERLTKKLKISEEEFLAELYSEQKLKTLGFNKNTVISLFIPNTYEVYWDITAEELIERMKKEYDLFWNEERTAKLLDVGLSKEEVSTLASIVEEETRRPS